MLFDDCFLNTHIVLFLYTAPNKKFLLSEGACSVREANRAVSEREAFANNASEDYTVTFRFLDTFYPSRFSTTTALRDMLFDFIYSQRVAIYSAKIET